MDADIARKSGYAGNARKLQPEGSAEAAAPGLTQRASLMLALLLSLGLWAAIWAAVASLASAILG